MHRPEAEALVERTRPAVVPQHAEVDRLPRRPGTREEVPHDRRTDATPLKLGQDVQLTQQHRLVRFPDLDPADVPPPDRDHLDLAARDGSGDEEPLPLVIPGSELDRQRLHQPAIGPTGEVEVVRSRQPARKADAHL
ncbi:MAG TPA: hypothetical protein VFG47_14420, partial [Geminicoccaceae bacterium]|nr:hypothetical protein [Geminicoccaceae bacterium]